MGPCLGGIGLPAGWGWAYRALRALDRGGLSYRFGLVAQRGFARNTKGSDRRFGCLPVARQTTKTDRLPHPGEKPSGLRASLDLVAQGVPPGSLSVGFPSSS